jgi:hypothetical protein
VAAWSRARSDLGPASALALEFAKDKLMPALGRLMIAWTRPAILVVLFSLTFASSFQVGHHSEPGATSSLWINVSFWFLAPLSVLLTLLFLPVKSQRIAVITGLGNAMCLLPLFNLGIYNPLVERGIGPSWSEMSGSFGAVPVTLGFFGLALINGWAWRRLRAMPDEIPGALGIAGTLVFLITFVPVCSDLVENLALRSLYELPAPETVAYTGNALTQYNNWIFVGTLFKAVVLVLSVLPLMFIAAACVATAMLGVLARGRSAAVNPRAWSDAFPAQRDVPWIFALAATGTFWILSHLIEPGMTARLEQMQSMIFHRGHAHGGVEIMVICFMIVFFTCGYELTRRLLGAARVRVFYASLIVAIEMAVLIALIALPMTLQEFAFNPSQVRLSAEPTWLTCLSSLGLLLLGALKFWSIRQRVRSNNAETSLWRFAGSALVPFGLGAGTVIAGAAAILVSSSFVLASLSVTYIRALLDWGQAVRHQGHEPFVVEKYVGTDQVFEWTLSGPGCLFLWLAVGLAIALMLSALEFIRFNSFRLYRLQKSSGTELAVAVNR